MLLWISVQFFYVDLEVSNNSLLISGINFSSITVLYLSLRKETTEEAAFSI